MRYWAFTRYRQSLGSYPHTGLCQPSRRTWILKERTRYFPHDAAQPAYGAACSMSRPYWHAGQSDGRRLCEPIPCDQRHGADERTRRFAYYGKLVRLTDLHALTKRRLLRCPDLLYRTETAGCMIRPASSAVRHCQHAEAGHACYCAQDIEGHINGQIDLKARRLIRKRLCRAELPDASLAGQAVEPADIDIRLEKGTVQSFKLALKTGDSLLAAGDLCLPRPVDMRVAARNFPSASCWIFWDRLT